MDNPDRAYHFIIKSFGYSFMSAPEADITFDLRRDFRDPARLRDLGLLNSDGDDPAVRKVVFETLGIPALLRNATALLNDSRRLHESNNLGPVVAAVGCSGGRHRAPSVAIMLAKRLRRHSSKPNVLVEHLTMHEDRILRPEHEEQHGIGGQR